MRRHHSTLRTGATAVAVALALLSTPLAPASARTAAEAAPSPSGPAAVVARAGGTGALTSPGDPAAAARNDAAERAAAATVAVPHAAPGSGTGGPVRTAQVPSVEAVAPRRVLDTRSTVGPTGGTAISAGGSVQVPVLGNGVPVAGVVAVLLNVTVVAGSSPGWVRVDDGTSTGTSTVDFLSQEVVANQVLVPVRNGSVRVTNGGSPIAVHVVLDVQGWVGAGAAVRPVGSARLLDTRKTGGTLGPAASGTYTLAVPNGIRGIVANVVAVPVGRSTGLLTAYAAGTPRPVTSNVNFPPGRPTSTLTVLPVDASGRVTVFNNATGSTDVVVDIEGYIVYGTASQRVYDSRRTLPSAQPLQRGLVRRVPVAGVNGVPADTGAVLAHLTITEATTIGYLTGWAWGSATPSTSSLNFLAGTTVTNTVLLPLGPDGALALSTTALTAHVVVDIQAVIARPALTAVAPTSLPTLSDTAPADTLAAQRVLAEANRYAMGPWWDDVAPGLLATRADRAMVTSGSSTNADAIRRLAMTALGLSTALATGTYDADQIGVSADVARLRVATILRRVATTHVATTPNGWGDAWQSTLWAGIAGRAAWMSWASLPVDVQQATSRMVEHEARYATTLPVTYYRDSTGTVVSAGNTYAEELSWRALPLQLALVMLPDHPDLPVWQNTMVRLTLAAWARPSDVRSAVQVNGAPVSSWVNGSNVDGDGVVVNHGRVAPDYSTNLYQNVDGALLCALAGQPYPRALTALLRPVYTSMSTKVFSAPPFAAPGGTIYTSGSQIYYPQGIDWGSGQMLPYALVDAEAQAFLGVDTADVLTRHVAGQEAMTARFTDGHTYGDPAEYVYAGREEHTSQLASQLLLTQLVRDAGSVSVDDTSYWLG